MKGNYSVTIQKFFCVISLSFILTCAFWYGGRFIYFYRESEKTLTKEALVLARILKSENKDNNKFKQIGQDYYFNGDVDNNYVNYSNMLWRIVKINKDNSIMLVSNDIVGTLAYGDGSLEYDNSILMNWLNKKDDVDNSGIFENILNDKEKYLIKNSTCIDVVNDISSNECNLSYDAGYIGLLSIQDYIYTGSNKGFINNGEYSYLANKNSNNEVWYINPDGKLDVTSGDNILGIKTTVTLSDGVESHSGDGSLENPYQIEDEIGFIGSYVKLGDDIWRITKEKDNVVQLVLNNTIDSIGGFKHIYSKKTYYHNDTNSGSLAHYLNNDYYNNLSYRDLILENTYENGFYGSDTDYNYVDISNRTIQTKISIPSIHDVIWNNSLDGYFTNTGLAQNSALVYVHKAVGFVSSEKVTTEALVVPCISIHKEKLTVGSGTLDDPFRTE